MKTFYLNLLLVFGSFLLHGQNTEKSTLIGNLTDVEYASNLIADPAGNTYVSGTSNNKGLLVKQNAVHQTLWSKILSFTTDPNDDVTISFINLKGDTLFGCGKIHQFNQPKGTFYFKMNAQTGTFYWTKYEMTSNCYFSGMRYDNGRYYLIGGMYGVVQSFGSKVLAISSQDGSLIWETPIMRFEMPQAAPQYRSYFVHATEMINGKMYITGVTERNGSNWTKMPLLIGIDENGVLFMEKFISIPDPFNMSPHYKGNQILLDQDGNIVIGIFEDYGGASVSHTLLFKCDPTGTVLFMKNYELDADELSILEFMNETPNSYVLFGELYNNYNGLYTLKVDKNGVFEDAINIHKPNVAYDGFSGYDDHVSGNSSYINGTHYFAANEYTIGAGTQDINQIILTDDLDYVEDCSELNTIPVVTTDITVTLETPNRTDIPHTMTFQNGIIEEEMPVFAPCNATQITMSQVSGCDQTVITASVSGFTVPTFYWSNGTVSTDSTLTVSSTDSIFLRVLDTKCCELTDSILPLIVPSQMTAQLPADTTLCLAAGATHTLTPQVQNPNATVTYLWSNNATGSTIAVNSSGTYWVEVSDSCKIVRDSIVLTIHTLPQISDTNDLSVCADDFPAQLNPTVTGAISMEWNDGSTTLPLSVSSAGTYTIEATNTCGTVSASIAVTSVALPDVDLIASIDTCIANGNSIPLIATVSNISNLLWSNGATTAQTSLSTSGTYTVYGSNSCGIDSASSAVTINFFPELLLPAVLDTCFEIGTGFGYTAQGSAGNYQWNTGANAASIWIMQEGTYTCTLTNVCGSVTDSMEVRRITAVEVHFPNDSIQVCETQLPVDALQIETNYSLDIYDPENALVGTSLDATGWYLLHAYNPCGEVWDSIYVDLQNEVLFYLPNTFTPNGDSHNEKYTYEGENMTIRSVHIYNRWGEEVYTEEGHFDGWDGSFRGEPCPQGVYIVSVIYENCFGIPTEFTGHVTVLR